MDLEKIVGSVLAGREAHPQGELRTPPTQHDEHLVDPDAVPDYRLYAPEELLDHEDPQNDRYFRRFSALNSDLTLTERQMLPRHVEVARLHLRGMRPVDIAKQLKYQPQSVSNALKRKDVQDYIRRLQHLNRLVEGPNLALRKNMLWRIAANNEFKDAQIAIQAIKELNKVDGAYPTAAPTQQTEVHIHINQDEMPKTALDAPLERLERLD
jgi:hypothetical protein